jgi:hypothetical protein
LVNGSVERITHGSHDPNVEAMGADGDVPLAAAHPGTVIDGPSTVVWERCRVL